MMSIIGIITLCLKLAYSVPFQLWYKTSVNQYHCLEVSQRKSLASRN